MPTVRRADRRGGPPVTDFIRHIGTVGFPVSKAKLYPYIDWIEISDTYHSLPKVATARKWRESAPGHVRFSLQLPRYLFETPPPGAPLSGASERYGGFKTTRENRKLFEDTVKVAEALESEVLVLATGAELTPSKNLVEALNGFITAVSTEGRTLVWQPAGLWEPRQAAETASRLGMVLAVDPLRDPAPEGPLAYFRLGPFAALGSRVGLYDLDRLVEASMRHERVIIVFNTPRSLDDARNLKRAFSDASPGEHPDS